LAKNVGRIIFKKMPEGILLRGERMKKILEGIRVLDLTTFMSGPFASMVLGDLGAEVIKIEEPGGGDGSRQIPPYFHERESLYYVSLNRNKKSVTLNLTLEQGKNIFYGLVKQADIVVENYRPGVTKKLGVDYERLEAINSRIIYCSITGYGSEGPYGQRPAYDLIIQALSGAMSMTGAEGTGPLRLGDGRPGWVHVGIGGYIGRPTTPGKNWRGAILGYFPPGCPNVLDHLPGALLLSWR